MNLPRSTPSAEGVDPRGILAFLDAMDAAPDIELHSLIVVRHGRVIAEGWWAPYAADRPHLLYSLSKSFTSTAAGFAVAEGLLDLDAPVITYFEEFAHDITDPRSREMRVRHIAAMASGHVAETLDRAIQRDPAEPVRGFLLIPPDRDPGTVFAYNQPCTYTLGTIVQKVTGQTLTEYLRPRLFEPLGIDRYGWLQGPPGRDLGFSGFHATTEAIARLGLVYLQRGRWADRQLLSEDWVVEATRRHVDNPDEPNPDWRQGYGFQFWMSRHGFRGDGAYGQFCLVLPEQDLVIATTADTENMQGILDAVWEQVLPAVGEALVDVGPAASAEATLAARLADAELPAVAAEPEPADPHAWAGRTFTAVPADPADPADPYVPPALAWVRLDHDDAGWSLRLSDRSELGGRMGSGRWHVTEGNASAGPLAISGGWMAAETLRADVIFLETPHRLQLECTGGLLRARWRTVPLHPLPMGQLRMPAVLDTA